MNYNIKQIILIIFAIVLSFELCGQFTLTEDQISLIHIFESTLFSHYTEDAELITQGRVKVNRYSPSYIANAYIHDEKVMKKIVKVEKGNRESNKAESLQCSWQYYFTSNLPGWITNIATKTTIKKQIEKAINIVNENSCGTITKSFSVQKGYLDIDYNELPLDIFEHGLKIYFTSNHITLEQSNALHAPISNDEALKHLTQQANCLFGKQVRVFPRNGNGESQNVLVIKIDPDHESFDASFFLRQIIHGIGHLLHEKKMQILRRKDDNYWHGLSPVNQHNSLPEAYTAAISEQAKLSVKEFVAEFYEYILLATPNFSIKNYKRNNISEYFRDQQFRGITAGFMDLLDACEKYNAAMPVWTSLGKVVQEFAATTGSTIWGDQNEKISKDVEDARVRDFGKFSPLWHNNDEEDLIEIDYSTVFTFSQIRGRRLSKFEKTASSMVAAIDNVKVDENEIINALQYWRQFKSSKEIEGQFNVYGLTERNQTLIRANSIIQCLNNYGPYILMSKRNENEESFFVVGISYNQRTMDGQVKCFFPYTLRHGVRTYSGMRDIKLKNFFTLLRSLNGLANNEKKVNLRMVNLY